MFGDFTSPVIGFNSCWESERLSDTKDVQTESIEQKTEDVQTTSQSESAVQTEVRANPVAEVDYDRLAEWLSAITPRVLEELDKTNRSHAFDDYEPGNGDSGIVLKQLHALMPPHPGFEVEVSSLSWSCTGAVVALGLCATQHPDWCNHSSNVVLYNINRHDFSPNEPTEVLRVSSCVTSLGTHPSEAFIFGCGTFNGEVIVWSLQQKEPVIVGSYTIHREAVTWSQWVRGVDSKVSSPLLVTAALDGLILLWTVGTRTGSLKLHKCFLLRTETLGTDLGVVSLSFNPSDPTHFVVAAEGGTILYCTTLGKRPVVNVMSVKLPPEIKEVFNPILTRFENHKGEVNGVEWVPDQKDVFMSCGSDRELRVYNVTQTKPIQVIYLDEPARGISFVSSPVRMHSRLVATWGASGAVLVYDANTGKRLSELDVRDAADSGPLTTVSFNTKSSYMLAVGNNRGRVKVWQAPFSKIATPNKAVVS